MAALPPRHEGRTPQEQPRRLQGPPAAPTIDVAAAAAMSASSHGTLAAGSSGGGSSTKHAAPSSARGANRATLSLSRTADKPGLVDFSQARTTAERLRVIEEAGGIGPFDDHIVNGEVLGHLATMNVKDAFLWAEAEENDKSALTSAIMHGHDNPHLNGGIGSRGSKSVERANSDGVPPNPRTSAVIAAHSAGGGSANAPVSARGAARGSSGAVHARSNASPKHDPSDASDAMQIESVHSLERFPDVVDSKAFARSAAAAAAAPAPSGPSGPAVGPVPGVAAIPTLHSGATQQQPMPHVPSAAKMRGKAYAPTNNAPLLPGGPIRAAGRPTRLSMDSTTAEKYARELEQASRDDVDSEGELPQVLRPWIKAKVGPDTPIAEGELMHTTTAIVVAGSKRNAVAAEQSGGDSSAAGGASRWKRVKSAVASPLNSLTRHRRRSACLLNKNRPMMRYWDTFMILLLLFTAIATPFEVAFLNSETGDIMFWINRVVDLGFLMDMVFNFFLPYHDPQTRREVTSHWMIAAHYIRTWFLLDLISIFPFDEVVAAASGSTNAAARLRLVRIVRLFKLAKLLRVIRASRIVQRWQTRIGLSFSVMQLSQFLIYVLLLAHWTGCGFYLLGTVMIDPEDPNTLSWIQTEDVFGKPYEAYVASVYWSVMTLATIGYGDVTAKNPVERLFSVMVMIIGGGTYAYVIGGVSNIVSNFDGATREHQQSMDELSRYTRELDLPQDLRERLREYFAQTLSIQRETYYAHLLQSMSPALRGEVAMQRHEEWISKVPFFNVPNRMERVGFVTAVAMELQPALFAKLETVQRAGQPITRMFIIQKGLATVQGRIVSRGHFFGEEAMLTISRAISTVRALTYLDVFFLSKEALERIIDSGQFQATRKKIRYAIIRMALRRELLKCAALARIQLGLFGIPLSAPPRVSMIDAPDEHDDTTVVLARAHTARQPRNSDTASSPKSGPAAATEPVSGRTARLVSSKSKSGSKGDGVAAEGDDEPPARPVSPPRLWSIMTRGRGAGLVGDDESGNDSQRLVVAEETDRPDSSHRSPLRATATSSSSGVVRLDADTTLVEGGAAARSPFAPPVLSVGAGPRPATGSGVELAVVPGPETGAAAHPLAALADRTDQDDDASVDDVRLWVSLLASPDDHEAKEAASKIRDMASRSAPACVSAGAVPALVELVMTSRRGEAPEAAAEALRSIAAGNTDCKAACVSAGAVPALVSLLSSSKGREAEQAAGALKNIAWGRVDFKMECVSGGAVPALVSLLSSSKGKEAEEAVGALRNLAKGPAAVRAACVSAGAVPALVLLLSSSKGKQAELAAQTLSSLAAGDEACQAACVSAGAVPALVSLLSSSKGAEAELAAMALNKIAEGDSAGKTACLEAGAVPALVLLLSSSKGREAGEATNTLHTLGIDGAGSGAMVTFAAPRLSQRPSRRLTDDERADIHRQIDRQMTPLARSMSKARLIRDGGLSDADASRIAGVPNGDATAVVEPPGHFFGAPRRPPPPARPQPPRAATSDSTSSRSPHGDDDEPAADEGALVAASSMGAGDPLRSPLSGVGSDVARRSSRPGTSAGGEPAGGRASQRRPSLFDYAGSSNRQLDRDNGGMELVIKRLKELQTDNMEFKGDSEDLRKALRELREDLREERGQGRVTQLLALVCIICSIAFGATLVSRPQ